MYTNYYKLIDDAKRCSDGRNKKLARIILASSHLAHNQGDTEFLADELCELIFDKIIEPELVKVVEVLKNVIQEKQDRIDYLEFMIDSKG